jgi:hypothetical protein
MAFAGNISNDGWSSMVAFNGLALFPALTFIFVVSAFEVLPVSLIVFSVFKISSAGSLVVVTLEDDFVIGIQFYAEAIRQLEEEVVNKPWLFRSHKV